MLLSKMCLRKWNCNISIVKISATDGQFRTQGSNFLSRLIFLKNFIMNPKQHLKLLATGCFVILLYTACNSAKKEQPKVFAKADSNQQHHAATLLRDNEVKAEAPDAETKTEQGYALPRHTAELSQSPINIITAK